METLLVLIGGTVAGAGGWWIGQRVGLMTAFMLSTVGTGLGMYLARRAARHYLG